MTAVLRFIQVSPWVSPVAHHPGQEGEGHQGDPEGGQSQRKGGLSGVSRQGDWTASAFWAKSHKGMNDADSKSLTLFFRYKLKLRLNEGPCWTSSGYRIWGSVPSSWATCGECSTTSGATAAALRPLHDADDLLQTSTGLEPAWCTTDWVSTLGTSAWTSTSRSSSLAWSSSQRGWGVCPSCSAWAGKKYRRPCWYLEAALVLRWSQFRKVLWWNVLT